MWSKDTFREAEDKLDYWYAELWGGGAEPDRPRVNMIRREMRRILHQLAYDAWQRGFASKTGGAVDMGIDLDLIEGGP